MNYSRGRSIEEVGKGIKGKRDKVIIGLKGTWSPTSDETFHQALRILGTDYVDILFWPIHRASSVNDSRKKEAFERLKKQGVRFFGEPFEFRSGVWIVYFYGPDGEVCT